MPAIVKAFDVDENPTSFKIDLFLTPLLAFMTMAGATHVATALDRCPTVASERIAPLVDLGAEVDFYPVHGTDSESIRASMINSRPVDNSGRGYDAYTAWSASWRRTSAAPQSEPWFVSLSVRVTLPCLHPLPAENADRWNRYFDAIVQHERQHVLIATGGRKRMANVLAKLPGASEGDVESLMQRQLAQIREQDAAFDLHASHPELTFDGSF